MDAVRVMVFYDGSYFKQGNVYFRYKEKRGWFRLPALHSLFERHVAEATKTSLHMTKVVSAHYYDGRATAKVSDGDQLGKERNFEMALIDAGIIPHFQPIREMLQQSSPGADPEYALAQKGVDVEFAIDVLDFAHLDRFDVAVLVAGDGDFVPLVRRVTSLGKHVLIAHFSTQKWIDDFGYPHAPTHVARALLDASSFYLDLTRLVDEPEWQEVLDTLFFMPRSAVGR